MKYMEVFDLSLITSFVIKVTSSIDFNKEAITDLEKLL